MAVDDGIIGKNPATNKKKLDLNGEKTERFALNDEQVHSICKALQGLPAKDALLVYMPLFVGTRRGETLGLKWADIDWAEGTIKVDRAIHFIDGQPHEGPPKTKAAYRTIPLLKELRDILEPLKGEPQQYIVSGDDAITESSYVRAWQRIKKKVHLFDATAHTLRHTYSTFIAQQLIPKEHQTVMGHSDLETTMKVYTHVDQERLTQKYKAIGSLYIVA